MPGFWNRILEVNLTTKEIGEISPGEDLYRDFIGGGGAGAKLLFDRLDTSLDPLDPGNPLIVMTGPLTCTNFFGSMTRYTVVGRSPLTGLFCEASCGGTFGNFFKKCGYDGIIVTGAADSPVCIRVADDSCEILPADDLWGKDTYETHAAIVKKSEDAGGKKPAVLAIGQAGENLVKYANMMNGPSNYAGRGGLGAVMGSKKLKAIAARGTKKPDFADPDAISGLRTALKEKIDGNIAAQSMQAFGTAGAVDLASMSGDIPIKNWRMGAWDEGLDKINGPSIGDKILTATHACLGCPVGCKRVVKVGDGPYSMEENAGPEYETIGSFGSMLMISDLDAIAKINDICNRYGMDTISCGGTIAFMTDLMAGGQITTDETGGLEFDWGKPEPVVEALHKIAAREDGIGDLLAEGSREVARRLGKGSDCLVEVKGMEVPMHDPRAFWGVGLNYAVGNRGACHVNTLQMFVEQGFAFYPEAGMGDQLDPHSTEGKATSNVGTQALGGILNSTCTCHFPAIPFDLNDYVSMINAATGLGYSIESLMDAGHRMWLLKRGINNMLGASRADDYLPERILQPTENGPTADSKIDLQAMLEQFYEVRGIDEKGRPSKDVLAGAGLAYLAEKLHG